MQEKIKNQGSAGTGSVIAIILFILVVLSTGTSVYFYKQLAQYKKDPQKVTQEEVDRVVGQVAAIMELPQGEKPTLATVADPSRLKDQPFFAHAKIGDKVLLYANARKAILYDPSENKIVEVAPINIGNQPPAPAPVVANPAPAPVADSATPTSTTAKATHKKHKSTKTAVAP